MPSKTSKNGHFVYHQRKKSFFYIKIWLYKIKSLTLHLNFSFFLEKRNFCS